MQATQRFAEQDHQPFEVPDFSFITDRIYAVMEMLGCRAKYSPIREFLPTIHKS